MKSLLLTFMMLMISSAALASEIDGKWVGVPTGGGTQTFEFRSDGKKLLGTVMGIEDSKLDIQKGKVSKKKVNFEVHTRQGSSKQRIVYKGKIISDNEIEVTFRIRSRGPRNADFGTNSGGGFDTGFGGGLGGFGGSASQESAPFILKRVENK